ncbi:hypothetical protein C1645_738359 [Glomus cerebriforme]|uniref:Shugoshin C-terminal domain-containing protein n=1 Tax=Glomus cerebriforme TaxID=658196 RepID=A0A397T0N9_9GLOM|nr:hypothetical protein C1645_738359 [Glomus cerebriforme]
MNSYPYFTLQQKLENIDESLKEIVQNYIQLKIFHYNRSNTSYALRLRESEIKNQQLHSENIGLRVTVAQLRAKVEKLRYQRAKTNDSFKESVKSASDKIVSLVQQLQYAADSLNTIVDPESARGSSFISDGSSILSATGGIQYSELMTDTDTITEMLPHKRKPVNLLTVYRKESKALVPIKEFKDEQKDTDSSTSEQIEEESLSETVEAIQQIGAKIPPKVQRNESSPKMGLKHVKNDHDLLLLQEKAPNVEAIFANNESTFKHHETDALRHPQDLGEHTKKEYLSVNVNTNQLSQKSNFSDFTHETRESIEPIMFLRANGPSPSQVTLNKSNMITSYERSFANTFSINHQLQRIAEKVESPFQDESYEFNNFQQMEASLQKVERLETRNKKHIRVETECVIRVNEGESRGRKRSKVNYAEPNLRSKLRKGDPHTYTLETESQK